MSEDSKPEDVQRIDVKESIRKAKAYVTDLMEGEAFNHLGLEQVRFDDRNNQWVVTLGLNRPWNTEKEIQSASAYSIGPPSTLTRPLRTYKKIYLDGRTGDFISMEDSRSDG